MNITEDNYQEAQDAIRDILYMYVDLIESYGGFGHNIERGKFSPLDFVDAPILEPEGYTFGIDILLLQSGSAIALLCTLSDAWDEYETWDVKNWPTVSLIKEANDAERFTHLPMIQEAFNLAFGSDEEAFREQLTRVYKKYVCSYFSKLAKNC
ncbi:MAG: hypothetical protein AAF206_03815 [Bacteroidota bacterium]